MTSSSTKSGLIDALTFIHPLYRLLYAVFVVSSENATVAELAATLQADLSQLQAAASFACRLGWAQKIIDIASVLQDTSAHGSLLSDDEDGSRASVSTDGVSVQQDYLGPENRAASNSARVAFIVDANITSYLMMGSVSPGLFCVSTARFSVILLHFCDVVRFL